MDPAESEVACATCRRPAAYRDASGHAYCSALCEVCDPARSDPARSLGALTDEDRAVLEAAEHDWNEGTKESRRALHVAVSARVARREAQP